MLEEGAEACNGVRSYVVIGAKKHFDTGRKYGDSGMRHGLRYHASLP